MPFIRSTPRSVKNYKSYKPIIRKDFLYKCGYCKTHENAFGGYRSFQIDHLKPSSIARFKKLVNTYTNLVYSCPHCNNIKVEHWPSDDPIRDGYGWLDPCIHDYDQHFTIGPNANGVFKATAHSRNGKWLIVNLGLDQQVRIQFIEKLFETKTRLREACDLFERLIQKLDENTPEYKEIKQQLINHKKELVKITAPQPYRKIKRLAVKKTNRASQII